MENVNVTMLPDENEVSNLSWREDFAPQQYQNIYIMGPIEAVAGMP